MPRCPRTTSRRGATARASRGSPGRGWGPRWRPRRCRSASSRRRVSATTRRSSPRRWPRCWRCSPAGSGWRSAPARRRTSTSPATAGRTRRPATARLAECVEVMRALFAGEEVTHHGLVEVDRARLWTLPPTPPMLLGAAVSPATAALGRRLGRRADHREPGARRSAAAPRRLPAGGGDGKPAYLQAHVCWAGTEDEALAIAHDQWRSNVFAPPVCWDLELPAHFDEAARHVRPDDVRERGAGVGRPGMAPRPARRAGGARLRRRLDPPRRPAATSRSSTCSASTSCPTSAVDVTPQRSPASPPPPICGGRTRSSTASTCRRSPTPTATASATSPG